MALTEEYLQATEEPRILQLGPAAYLGIDGHGPPGDPAYQQSIGALMAVAASGLGPAAHGIKALETIYWTTSHEPLHKAPQAEWRWRHLIRLPTEIDREGLKNAKAKAKGDPKLAATVKHRTLNEGTCAQVLHKGPYKQLGDAYAKLYAYLGDNGYRQAGRIHELYLNNPDEVPAAELLTICRVPIQKL